MKFSIFIPKGNNKLVELAIQKLLELGYKYGSSYRSTSLEHIKANYHGDFTNWNYLHNNSISPNDDIVDANSYSSKPDSTTHTIDDLFSGKIPPAKPTSIEVQLNDSYTAVVSKDSIKVGCQTFPASILRTLIQANDKLQD